MHGLRSTSRESAGGGVDLTHVHEEGQLLFATSGFMRTSTPGGSWLLSANFALWIPPGLPHSVEYRGTVSMRSLYFSQALEIDLPAQPRMLEVSPLLRELIQEAVRLDQGSPDRQRLLWIKQLIADDIRTAGTAAFKVASPLDARLHKMSASILSDPADNRTLEEWARLVGMSSRSFTRRFREETGTSFTIWRQLVRLQESLIRLDMGQSVTAVAYDVGYQSPATFSTIFRQHFGVPPSRYRDVRERGRSAGRRSSPPS